MIDTIKLSLEGAPSFPEEYLNTLIDGDVVVLTLPTEARIPRSIPVARNPVQIVTNPTPDPMIQAGFQPVTGGSTNGTTPRLIDRIAIRMNSFKPNTRWANQTGVTIHNLVADNPHIWFMVVNGHLRSVSVSLPRLLFPENGHLITSQREIDLAMRRLHTILGLLLQNTNPLDFRFTRVDLVLQFAFPSLTVPRILEMMQYRSFQTIRNHAALHRNHHRLNSLVWKGTNLRITAYNKEREMGLHLDRILRLEVQLQREALLSHLGIQEGEHLRRLDFNSCYQAYRHLVAPGHTTVIHPAPRGQRAAILSILAEAVRQNWVMPSGQSPLDVYLASLSSPTRRAFRRDFHNPEVIGPEQIVWDAELPLEWPPPRLVTDARSYQPVTTEEPGTDGSLSA